MENLTVTIPLEEYKSMTQTTAAILTAVDYLEVLIKDKRKNGYDYLERKEVELIFNKFLHLDGSES